jgi:hypothetical protein
MDLVTLGCLGTLDGSGRLKAQSYGVKLCDGVGSFQLSSLDCFNLVCEGLVGASRCTA